jgi:hypothetical protein
MSIFLHALLLGGATVLVVKVVQAQKEKLKFTAPPPAPPAAEHRVKPSKKNPASAPEVSKRITSLSANTQIALPEMQMNSSAPDVMASVMGGLGASGLGSGAGGAGMASMPLAGLTAFGFKGASRGGLVGRFYDLRQFADRRPAEAAKDGLSSPAYYKIVGEFFSKNWDDAVLKRYYCAPDSMLAVQFYMKCSGSSGAAAAFGVEKETKSPLWVIHYKGEVVAPEDGDYRFWASCDDFMAVRFDGKPVLASDGLLHNITPEAQKVARPDVSSAGGNKADAVNFLPGYMAARGCWFHVERGRSYPMDVLIGDTGGLYHQILLVQERYPKEPYPVRTSAPLVPRLPLLQFRKGIPIPVYDPKAAMIPAGNGDYSRNPEPAPAPVIFTAK